MILELIIGILTLVAEWMIFKKMGRQGWEGIVPFYNTYVLCQELYGNGWKFLLLLIPIYNIYFVIKMNIDWAKAFNQGVGFGIGLLLLPFIFQLILAFGGEQYRDGSSIPIPSPTWWRMWSTRPRMPFPATGTTTRSSNCTKQNGTGEHPVPFFHVFKRNERKERMKKLIALLLADGPYCGGHTVRWRTLPSLRSDRFVPNPESGDDYLPQIFTRFRYSSVAPAAWFLQPFS